MAIVTFLLSLAARKANDIVQAVFGWSVTALFGRLRRRSQVLVTTALVLSLVWPVFVIGVFAPEVTSWAIAMVPLHHWIGDTALRIVWISLAVAAPIGVGLLVHLAVPTGTPDLLRGLLRGYAIALGFFIAFLVVVITVPVVKLASLIRRWSDDHIYVQPHDGAYDDVLACLAEACSRAGLDPKISDAPRSMVLATTVMHTLARGAVSPFVAEKLRRVTADGVELYLYPGDLLLRGAPFKVARVRAMLGRTELDANAYLVDSDAAKSLQDEFAHLAEFIHSHGDTKEMVARLERTYHELLHVDVSYEDWIVLDGLARRLERELVSRGAVAGNALPLDEVGNSLGYRGTSSTPELPRTLTRRWQAAEKRPVMSSRST